MELFSQDAETAVLSAILKTPERVYNLNGLRPHMLSHITNISLLDNMINMGENNLQPNKQLVSSLLGASGKLDLVGGDAYLDYLINQPQQTPENIDAFIEGIKESYKTREFLSLINKIDLDAIKRDGATEVIGNTQLELDKLLSNSGTGFIRQVGSLYNDVFDDIVKRTENPGIRGCPTGFKGLDVITGGYGKGDLWIVAGRPSMGKCLGYGTKVMMADGSLKEVQNVKIGDKLMGVNSTHRTVLSTTYGMGQMYNIKQARGVSYRVNEFHVLSLKRSKTEKKQIHGTIRNESVLDILKHQRWIESRFKGYKVSVDFPEKEVVVEPYYVGLWLGDGNSSSLPIYNIDKEIIDYLHKYANRVGLHLSVSCEKKKTCKSYNMTNNHKGNFILDEFHKLDLLSNKHIPDKYLYTSRENRLQLLAGLLDSDGHTCARGQFEIIQKNKTLALQIKFLADTLGYNTKITEKVAKCQTGVESIVWRVYISGNVSEIPTKVERKQCKEWTSIRDWTMRGIKIEKDSFDSYFGFMLDGDGLFLLEDCTVTHNSALISNSQLCMAKTNQTTLTFSKEMNTESLVERLISIDTGLSLSDIRLGNIVKADIELIRSKKDAFKDYRIFLDSNFGADVHYIESAVRKYVQLNGVQVVFIDYLQLLSERDENQTQELGRITKKLKLLAEKLQICIVLLSQLNRSLESRENKRPILSDMRQSGSIEEDADVVVGLYRDEYYNGTESKLKGVVEFIILKQRNGPIGTIPMKFTPDNITIISP